jgi:sulfur relay (sulfurtransferase) DsrF/TusC family protein
MAKAGYLFIESRDPWESTDTRTFHETAIALARSRPVTVFFVQNGVLAARAGATATGLDELKRAGIEVLADDFSLRERGISERIDPRVKASPLDAVIDQLAEGRKVLWH